MSIFRFIPRLLCALALLGAFPAASHAQVRTLKAVSLAGKRYVAIADLAAMYGLPLTAPDAKTLQIRGQTVSILFSVKERKATVNGTVVWLHAPVTQIRKAWYISDADAQFVIDPILRPSAYLSGRGTATVVLDPGHGGKDPGAIAASGLQEKAVALDIAKRVRAHLAAAGLRVLMTRENDTFLELADRPAFALRNKADLFVAIHLNSTANRAVQGIETYATAAENYPSTSDGVLTKPHAAVPNNRFNHSSTDLAFQIQKALVGITRAEDRGLKRARYVVIRESAMPAALVECGFLSNAQEALQLSTPSRRETIAQGIAQGILNYIALVNRAKIDLGAPVIQKPAIPGTPTAPAPGAPVAPANQPPTPMASRAFAPPPRPPVAAPTAAPAAAPSPAPAPVPRPLPSPVPAAAPTPPQAPAIPPTAPQPVRPPTAVAPPPSSLLNPNFAPRPAP